MKYLYIAALLSSQVTFAQFRYPVAKKIPQIETRFGEMIEDPYKWMENPSDPDLWNWISLQKKFTSNYLDLNYFYSFKSKIIEFKTIRDQQELITKVEDAEKSSTSTPNPDFLFENQDQPIKVWSSSQKVSKISKVLKESPLYQIEEKAVAGGDIKRLIVTQKSDNKLKDILLIKFNTIVGWASEESFYYISDRDDKNAGGKPGLYLHIVGNAQAEDQLLLSGTKASSEIEVHQIGDKSFVEVDNTISSIQLETGKISNTQSFDGTILEITDSPQIEATILSYKNSNNGELTKLRLRDGQRRPFLKDLNFTILKTKRLIDDTTLIIGVNDGAQVAGIYKEGSPIQMLDLTDGTIEFKTFKDGILKITHETFSSPKKLFSYNLETKELKVEASQTFPLEVQAEKIKYLASNGQEASMWLMRKKGVTLNSQTPTIFYGYGGFRVSVSPTFGIYESLAWMDKGGAFVVVTLPGSLDYGNSWYDLAKVGGRIHPWDSFALAAQELYKRGISSPEAAGIMGASNGGTLTAGTLERHGELFKAAVPIVGVMDLINFPLFTAGKYWTEDYGNPFTEKDFNAIYPLSPYHNLKKKNYPATMVMTAEFDDRVVPMHSYKYLARLQEYNTSNNPILLYSKEWGGHSKDSGPIGQRLNFLTAYFTFFAQQLGLN
ncbi:MAG: prolyl oligopeptidase family serine peptidase [Bacteriovoracaceae bacterium]